MKKLLYSALLSILFLNAAAQQNGFGFRLGLTAHPTFGWMKSDNVKGEGASTGFSYGLLGDFGFAENYSFSTAFLITTVNSKYSERLYKDLSAINLLTATAPSDLKYKIQYIEVPLTLKLKTSGEGKITGYGQFGVTNGFKISAKVRDYAAGTEGTTDAISFYRAGLLIGGGAELAVGKAASLTGGLTFNNGITYVGRDASQGVRNHYISLNIGMFF